MKSASEINRLIKQMRFSPSGVADKRILEYTQTVLKQRPENGSNTFEPNVWRTIMRSPITKLAAAAVVLIAVLTGIHHFNGTIDGASVAWAEMQETFSSQNWVHIKYNSGRETWISLINGNLYNKGEDGAVTLVNRSQNVRQEYRPDLGEYISEGKYSNKLAKWEPQSAWSLIIEPLVSQNMSGPTGHGEINKEIEDVNGNHLVRFDQYWYDLEGRKKMVCQIWADSKAHLPIRIKEEQENGGTLIGVFDFPETGPQNIYDLGVRKDLPVIGFNTVCGDNISKILDAAKEAYARFPVNYRAITWPLKGNREVDVVYRFGEMIHYEHYLCSITASDINRLKAQASSEEVLEWIGKQTPYEVVVFDGSTTRITTNSPMAGPSAKHSEPQKQLVPTKHVPIQSEPHNEFWPYIAYKSKLDLINNPQEQSNAYIGLRDERGDTRRDYYIDPEHDYICVREIWWKLKSNRWIKEREWERSDFAQLSQGQWYPTKKIEFSFRDVGRRADLNETHWRVDFKIVDKTEYLPDLFN